MSRYYEKDGKKFVSVTTVIADCTPKNWGIQWGSNCVVEWIKNSSDKIVRSFDNSNEKRWVVSNDDLDKARFAHKDISKQAKGVGSEVHYAIEKWLQKKKYELTSRQAVTAFNAFLEWQADVDLKPIELEHTVWGDRWAGTCDFVGVYKGKLYVIDWKTSKAFYPEMRYQVAAYRSAIHIELKHTSKPPLFRNIEGCGILRLDKETGTPEFKDTSKTYEQDLRVWNSMVTLYYARHPRIRARFEKEIT